MDNRFNIPVLPARYLSDGVTQEARRLSGWKCWAKAVGRFSRQIHWINSESRKDVDPSGEADLLTPCCQEKLLANRAGNRTKTDTGRKVEHTKARERNLVKELGNIAP